MTDNDSRLDALYHRGATTIYASRYDQRFSYTLYVPVKGITSNTKLLVSVHGTGRMQSLYRDLFSDFAEEHDCIVIAPLFPAWVLKDNNMSGYKYILEGNIRYDLVMIDMIAEVAERYEINVSKILMFGFSGGGHFTHRFTLLHPHRIFAASVGAPGSVTLLDFTRPWWTGLADVEQKFGLKIDRDAYKQIAMHFVVGADDTETWEITFQPDDARYMPGANDAGATRPERIRSLAASFKQSGARVSIDEIAGATHDVTAVAPATTQFFSDALAGWTNS